jgi:hypothetical protein
VPAYGFSVTEHDDERPWIVVQQRHETIELPDDVSFHDWAGRQYPSPRFTVQVDPLELSPGR